MLAFGKVIIAYTKEVTRKITENGIKKEKWILRHKIPMRVLMLYQGFWCCIRLNRWFLKVLFFYFTLPWRKRNSNVNGDIQSPLLLCMVFGGGVFGKAVSSWIGWLSLRGQSTRSLSFCPVKIPTEVSSLQTGRRLSPELSHAGTHSPPSLQKLC